MLVDEVERLGRLVSAHVVEEPHEPVELDLDAIVDHVVLGRRAAGQHVTWTPTGTRALGRHDDLIEVLNILLVNADRHAPRTPAHVVVSHDNGAVRISVIDDGPGVPEHLREAIFEPFRQGPSVSSHSPGTGIGLSLVGRFAQIHGGRAWVEDRPGGGASFKVFLPDGPEGTAAASAEPSPADSTTLDGDTAAAG